MSATKGTYGNLVESITDRRAPGEGAGAGAGAGGRRGGRAGDKVQSPRVPSCENCTRLSSQIISLISINCAGFIAIKISLSLFSPLPLPLTPPSLSLSRSLSFSVCPGISETEPVIGINQSIDFARKETAIMSRSDPISGSSAGHQNVRARLPLYDLPCRITDGLPLPTRGLILDIEPEKEGRTSPRGETPERWHTDSLPHIPFCLFNVCSREWGDEKRETEKRGCSSSSTARNRDVRQGYEEGCIAGKEKY